MVTRTRIIVIKAGDAAEYLLTPNINWEQPLFITSEFIRTRIKFIGKSDEKLWIEHINEPDGVLLSSGDTLQLITGDDGFVPGSFIFKWYTKSTTFSGSFRVTPHNLNNDVLGSMYCALEERIYGITRNQHAITMLQSNENQNDENQRLLLLFSTHYDDLMRNLIAIGQYPQEVMTNEYQRTQTSKKTTAKSVRWQASKGGASHHTQYFEQRKQISYDTAENQYLKHILINLLQKMDKIRQFGHESLARQRQLRQGLIEEIKELRATKGRLGSEKNFATLTYDLNNRLQFRNEACRQLTNEIAQNEARYQPIFNLYAKISQLLNESWMKSVTQKYRIDFPKRILNLNHYRLLVHFYQQFIMREEDLFRFPRNQTSLLFEYFCVFLVQEILESRGFKCLGKQKEIPFDSRILFKHESGQYIYLSYDRFIGDLTLARAQKQEQLISIIGGSRKPDILLEFYDVSGEFKRAFIIEVKYRRLKNIYRGDINTDVVNQLNAYSTFKYYQPDRKLSPGADVSNIAVIYPQHEDSQYFEESVLGYGFIPIVPSNFSLGAPSFDPLIRNIDKFLD